MNDAAYKLLGHLYDVVPEKQSANEILNETFSNTDNISVDKLLGELINDGYVYQWKGYSDGKTDQYGVTPKGILFYDHYGEDKKPTNTALLHEEVLPVQNVATVVQLGSDTEDEDVQGFSFRRAIPVIILIVFAIAIVWVITHFKKTT